MSRPSLSRGRSISYRPVNLLVAGSVVDNAATNRYREKILLHSKRSWFMVDVWSEKRDVRTHCLMMTTAGDTDDPENDEDTASI